MYPIHFKQPTTHYKLHTAHYTLPTRNFTLLTAYFMLQTALYLVIRARTLFLCKHSFRHLVYISIGANILQFTNTQSETRIEITCWVVWTILLSDLNIWINFWLLYCIFGALDCQTEPSLCHVNTYHLHHLETTHHLSALGSFPRQPWEDRVAE